MAFQKINSGGNAMDIKKQSGTPFVGVYMGHKDIETPLGKQVIWQFIDEDERPFGIFGFTSLNRAMESIKTGTLVRITHTGQEKMKTKFGMRDVHICLVEVDDGK